MMLGNKSLKLSSGDALSAEKSINRASSTVTMMIMVISIIGNASAFTPAGIGFVTGPKRRGASTASYSDRLSLSSLAMVRRNKHLDSSRLRYREGHDDDSFGFSSPGRGSGPWFATGGEGNGDKQKPTDYSTKQQEVVDDYLEFLDRRYQRLRSDDESRDTTFSVWKWLTHGAAEDEKASLDLQQQNESKDSLYVLGVADLASQKLLQKHQLANKRDSAVSEEAEVTVNHETSLMLSAKTRKRFFVVSTLVVGIMSLLEKIAATRRSIIEFQTSRTKEVLSKLGKFARFAPSRAAKSFLNMGGGKRTIALTLTVLAVLTLLFNRPLGQVIASETTAPSISQ